jgi:hypothetical protein
MGQVNEGLTNRLRALALPPLVFRCASCNPFAVLSNRIGQTLTPTTSQWVIVRSLLGGPNSLAVLTSTLEVWIVAQYRVAALFADVPARPFYHWSGVICQHAIWATHSRGHR